MPDEDQVWDEETWNEINEENSYDYYEELENRFIDD